MMMCDPPSGWKYGFPKPVPGKVLEEDKVLEWLVEQGYPQAEIDRLGDQFYCGYWETEEKEH